MGDQHRQGVIGYWGEEVGRYLVASTDPNVMPEAILEYFEEIIEASRFD